MAEKDEAEILADKEQHAERCPSCLSRRSRQVPGPTPGEFFMGCDACGHTWVGKDFDQHESEKHPIPE